MDCPFERAARPPAIWMGDVLRELSIIVTDCRAAARDPVRNSDQVRTLLKAAGQIEASIALLEGAAA